MQISLVCMALMASDRRLGCRGVCISAKGGSNSAHLFVLIKVARVHSRLIRALLGGGGRSWRLTNAYTEAWALPQAWRVKVG